MNNRGSGILLHITSLPSPHGIGDFGPEARRFVDFLADTGQKYWQILPLNPINPAQGSSPYTNMSAMGINAMLISPEHLQQDGLLPQDEEPRPALPEDHVDYREVIEYKKKVFRRSWNHFRQLDNHQKWEFNRFCEENSRWLDDYALFVALKEYNEGASWDRWPPEQRDRHHHTIAEFREKLGDEISRAKYLQFIAAAQWQKLKQYCNRKGIHVFGDLPIYVDYDSVDVWAHPDIFKLNDEKRPAMVAGVPPDYFSATGQRWGNPVYNWDVLRQQGYNWWLMRMEWNLQLFDLVRIDHFRGLVAYWEIPAEEETAINGKWVHAPVYDFLDTLGKRFFNLPVVAEDLGTITADVRLVMEHYRLPAMKVLHFAFGDDNPMHPYLPHTYETNCVVYTGTHDNNTTRGWFENETSHEMQSRLAQYTGKQADVNSVHWDLIRLAMSSVADMAIIPMQDVLGLGQECRMNTPSTSEGNWRWRMRWEQLNDENTGQLRHLTRVFGR